MGFTSMEARLALRASLNDMDTAVGLIFKVFIRSILLIIDINSDFFKRFVFIEKTAQERSRTSWKRETKSQVDRKEIRSNVERKQDVSQSNCRLEYVLKTYNLSLIFKRINVKTLNDIVQFGYTERQAALALKKAENDFNLALDVGFSIFLIRFFVSWINDFFFESFYNQTSSMI